MQTWGKCAYIYIFSLFYKTSSKCCDKGFRRKWDSIKFSATSETLCWKSLYLIYITLSVGLNVPNREPASKILKGVGKGEGYISPLPRTAFAKMYSKLGQEVWFTGSWICTFYLDMGQNNKNTRIKQ